ncbi:DUF3078 domain-containing protein [Salibacteraceae bacterium]|nr:DUF3078 domain-containing protein [Salibacteraceae bacterium]
MRKIGLILMAVCFAQGVNAQGEAKPDSSAVEDTVKGPWTKGGVGSINFNQVSLNNWAAGGNSSISGAGLLNAFANYEKEKVSWDNNIVLAYGLIRQEKQPVIKSDDRIEIVSKAGKTANKKWSYTGLFSFRTQFAPGFDDPVSPTRATISDFLSPAYMQLALGMEYKPNKKLSAFISPLANKTTIVTNQTLANAGAFGVEAAEYDALGNLVTEGLNARYEVGGYLKFMYQDDIMKNVTFQTKVDLFSNYLNNPENIDVNWEALLAFKVNKFITASIATHLIYDDDILIGVDTNDDGIVDGMGKRTQFKEVLSIGFSYKF